MVQCSRCGEEKRESEFNVSDRRESGLVPWCKACSSKVVPKKSDEEKWNHRTCSFGDYPDELV